MPDVEANETAETLDSISFGQIAHSVYALFYNKRFGLILILVAGLLSLFGVIFPQMPSGVRDNPEAYASWLDNLRGTYGGWTNIMVNVGLFSMFSSTVFLVAMVLLAASILACTTHRLPLLWRNCFEPRTVVKPSFFTRARYTAGFETSASAAEVGDALRKVAKKRSLRLISNEDETSFYLDRFRFAPFGTVAAHIAIVIIMVGFLVSSMTGFREENFALTVDIPREVGHGTHLVAKANSFQDDYYPDGTPKDYVTDLSILADGNEVARQDVRVNSPLKYNGIMFHQANFGVSAVISVSEGGEELFNNGVGLVYLTPDKSRSYGVVKVPDRDYEIYLIAPASGRQTPEIAPGQVQIEVYPVGEKNLVGKDSLDPGQNAEIAGLTIGFEKEAQFTGLLIKKDPGTGFIWIGSLLLVIGMCATMFLRHRRIWVRYATVEGKQTVQLASMDKPDVSFEARFAQFKDEVSNALVGSEETAEAPTGSELAEKK